MPPPDQNCPSHDMDCARPAPRDWHRVLITCRLNVAVLLQQGLRLSPSTTEQLLIQRGRGIRPDEAPATTRNTPRVVRFSIANLRSSGEGANSVRSNVDWKDEGKASL